MKKSLLTCVAIMTFGSVWADDIMVTKATGDKTVSGSLAYAIENAKNGDIIKFDITFSPDEVTAGSNLVKLDGGEVFLRKSITIDGKDITTQTNHIISVPEPGVTPHRLFVIGDFVNEYNVTIKNCSLYGGNTSGDECKNSADVIVPATEGKAEVKLSRHWGATLTALDNVTLLLENITIDKSKGGYAAALMNTGAVTTMQNCTIKNMTGNQNGTTIYNNYINKEYKSGQLTIDQCHFLDNTSGAQGGAVFSSGGNITISNSRFINLKASANAVGGAISISNDTQLTASNCDFENCTAGTSGGAIALTGTATANISSSRFKNNVALGVNVTGKYYGGGALYIATAASTVNISNTCVFDGNDAHAGGAIYIIGSNDNITGNNHQIKGSIFKNNTSRKYHGGAIQLASDRNLDIVDCEFISNKAGTETNAYGGATYTHQGTIHISESLFESNTAASGGALFTNSTSTGGGIIYIDKSTVIKNEAGTGGGLWAYAPNNCKKSYIYVNNCYFAENIAKSGYGSAMNVSRGGTGAEFPELTVKNTTIYNNKNIGASGNVGATIGAHSILNIYNCTVVGNSSSVNGGGILSTQQPLTIYNTIVTHNKLGEELDDISLGTASLTGSIIGSNNIIGAYRKVNASADDNGFSKIDYTNQKLYTNVDENNPIPTPEGMEGQPLYIMIADDGIAARGGMTGENIPTTDQRGILRNTTSPSIGAIEIVGTSKETGIKSNDNTVHVYPSPAQGTLYIKDVTAKRVLIFDMMNRLMMDVQQPNGSINVSSLLPGIYTISIWGENIINESFIVE